VAVGSSRNGITVAASAAESTLPRRRDIMRPAAIQIRHAVPGDAEQWRLLRLALWPEEDPAAHAAEVSRFFAEPRPAPGAMPEAVLVAVEAETPRELIGFAEVSRRAYAEGCETSPVGFLEGWYVVGEHRRRGVGRALVTAAEAWARGMGCSEFASDALAENTASAAAHRALGFEEVEVIRCFRKRL
jgi:aminoglycoside 6'-N-acetyltransferase I